MKTISFSLWAALVLVVWFFSIQPVFTQKFKVGMMEIGINGGVGITTLQFRNTDNFPINSDTEYQVSAIPYFNIGGAIKWRINDKFSIIPKLQLSRKGFHIQSRAYTGGDELLITIESTDALYYVNLPVFIYYDTRKIFLGAGVYSGFAIFGKTNGTQDIYDLATGSSRTDSYKQKIVISGNRADAFWMSRFDFGITGEVGYKIKGIYYLSAIYEHGFWNVVPQYDFSKSFAYHRSVSLSFAYYFRQKS